MRYNYLILGHFLTFYKGLCLVLLWDEILTNEMTRWDEDFRGDKNYRRKIVCWTVWARWMTDSGLVGVRASIGSVLSESCSAPVSIAERSTDPRHTLIPAFTLRLCNVWATSPWRCLSRRGHNKIDLTDWGCLVQSPQREFSDRIDSKKII